MVMISATWPLAPWSAVVVAGIAGLAAGLLAGELMKLALRKLGHEGYVAESADERTMRVYTEKAKQGMKD